MSTHESRQRKLLEVRAELERRVRSGERWICEELLSQNDDLRGDEECVLELIYAEYATLEEAGAGVPPGVFYERFPEIRDRLSRIIDLHRVMEEDEDGLSVTHDTPRGLSQTHPLLAGEGPSAPQVSSDYEVESEIGRGGMGIVYRARHVRLGRTVALKMIRSPLASGEELARLQQEAETVARLEHPNIVSIYEIGSWQGCPFLSLEYVEGGSLNEKLDGNPLPAEEAAELARTIAEAVHFAHQNSVVHRDLKPGNVLLTANGAPKITDFGLAKQLRAEDGEQAYQLTHSGALLGTPSYMSPEQATGRSREIGPAADIYAVGAVLYEMLTGRPPFRGESTLETLEQIRHVEPIPPRRLRTRVPRDLETVCLKCLEKDPRHRYATAGAVADDLGRYLAGEPVLARPVGRFERSVKWARRRPAIAALLVALCLVTAVGVAGILYQWLRAESSLVVEQHLRQDAQINLYFQQIAVAHRDLLAGDFATAEELLDGCSREFREWEWRYLKRLCHQEMAALENAKGPLRLVAYGPRGTTIVTVGGGKVPAEAGEARLFDAADGTIRTRFAIEPAVTAAAVSPDGALLATASNSADVPAAKITIWDLHRGERLRSFTDEAGEVPAIAFGPHAARLVTGGRDGLIRVFNTASGGCELSIAGHQGAVTDVAFSPDGDRIASASLDASARVWNASDGQMIQHLPGTRGRLSVAFSPDGRQLVTGGFLGSVQLWDFAARPMKPHIHHVDMALAIHDVAFDPDGRMIAGADSSGTVYVWDVVSRDVAMVLRGLRASASGLAFSPNGVRIAAVDEDGGGMIWDTMSAQEPRIIKALSGFVADFRYRPDGEAMVFAPAANPENPRSRDFAVRLFDTRSDRTANRYLGHDDWLVSVCFRGDGEEFATASQDGTIRVWDANSPDCRKVLDVSDAPATNVCYGRDVLLAATAEGTIRCFDMNSFNELAPLIGHEGRVTCLATSGDGVLLLSGDEGGSARAWDIATGRSLARTKHAEGVAAVAWLPGTERPAVATGERVLVWDSPAAMGGPSAKPQEFVGHVAAITSVTFSPDGLRMATASEDQSVRLWDVATGKQALTLRKRAITVHALQFRPDGNELAAASGESIIQWSTLPPRPETVASRSANWQIGSVQWHRTQANACHTQLNWGAALTHRRRAIAILEAMISDAPGDPMLANYLAHAEWGRGSTRYQSGDHEAGIVAVRRAAGIWQNILAPDAVKASGLTSEIERGFRESLFFVHLDACRMQTEIGQSGLEDLQAALPHNPGTPASNYRLAHVMVHADEPEMFVAATAIALAEDAVSAQPNQAEYWNTLAAAQFRGGNYWAAAGAYRQAKDLAERMFGVDQTVVPIGKWKVGIKERVAEWLETLRSLFKEGV